MKKNCGFIIPLLLLSIAILIIGGITYSFLHPTKLKNSPSQFSNNQSYSNQISEISKSPLAVNLLINGSHATSTVKYGTELHLSWNSVGKVEKCESYGSYVLYKNHKDIWAQDSTKVLPPSGAVVLLATAYQHEKEVYSPNLIFTIVCYNNVGMPAYNEARDEVMVNVIL